MHTLTHILDHLNASFHFRKWADTQPDARTVWFACPCGDWLLSLAAELDIDRRILLTIVCDWAELALPYMLTSDEHPQNAIATTRAWIAGEATLEQIHDASRAVWEEALPIASEVAWIASELDREDAHAFRAAVRATWAAIDTIRAAQAAAGDVQYDFTAVAPSVAADAADAVAAAAESDDIDATTIAAIHADTLRQCADIVRSHITWEQVAEAIERMRSHGMIGRHFTKQ